MLLALGLMCHEGAFVYASDETVWDFSTSDPDHYVIVLSRAPSPHDITSLLRDTTKLETLTVAPREKKESLATPVAVSTLCEQEAVALGLGANTTLTSLKFEDFMGADDGCLARLLCAASHSTSLRSLASLSFKNCQIESDGLVKLGQCLTQRTALTDLSITWCGAHMIPEPVVTSAFIPALKGAGLHSLTLDAPGGSLTTHIKDAVRQSTTLSYLSLSVPCVRLSERDTHLEELLQHPTLETLHLLTGDTYPITPGAMVALGTNASLTSLFLTRSPYFMPDSQEPFLNALRQNTTLVSLNAWAPGNLSDVQKVEEALEGNGTLRSMNLLGSSQVPRVVEKNMHNFRMHELRLSTLMLSALAPPVATA